MTPYDRTQYDELKPVGKFVLVELIEEKPQERKTPAGIIIPGTTTEQPATFGLVRAVGPEVTQDIKPGDFIEANQSFYSQFKDIDGAPLQMISQDYIAGVYKKK